jgi:creatinine amidohydrolase
VTVKLRLAELTSGEAKTRLSNRPTILLPMGSLEDQGPQAPMGDYLLADAIALRIAERVVALGGDALVAPVLPFGGEDYFNTVPGGIALSHATLLAVIREMLTRLIAHGLDRIVIVNGHGGNVHAIHEATMAVKHADGTLIPSLYIWRNLYAAWPRLSGADTAGRMGHGADPVWSVARALFPGLCRPDLIPPPAPAGSIQGMAVTGLGAARFGEIELGLPIEYDLAAPSGVLSGDPRRGDAELGARAVDWIAEQGARLILHLRDQG